MSEATSHPHGFYWSQAASALMGELGSSEQGLSSAAAQLRLAQNRRNALPAESATAPVRLLLRQFASPLVLILVFGAALSIGLGEWVDAGIILGIVLGSALLGFMQEYRASLAVSELRRRLALSARVRREGGIHSIPASQVVPGDLVLLSAGNLVPGDGLVLEAKDFLVTEAALTGESFPVEKHPGVVPADAPVAARTNSVLLGTSVRSGTATVLIVHTGRDTSFGAIAHRLAVRRPESEFERGIRRFGYLLVRVMVVMVLFVLTVHLLLHRPAIEALLFAVALAVGLSPELLPAIVSVTLSAGARAMARRGVIVRRLEAIENLGSIDVLCTDKTGTLTEGVVTLSEALSPDGRPSDEARRLAYINAAFETGIDNPLDAAIVAAGAHEGLSTHGWRKVDEIPYDFLRKRLTIVAAHADDPARHRIISKGAFGSVLTSCASVVSAASEAALDEALRERLDAWYRKKGTEGFRVLALAVKPVAPQPRYEPEDERDMVFAGFLVFHDPPKRDAQRTIGDLAALGIRIKIISGDNRYVTAHVAQAIGLRPEAMLTGEEMRTLRDEALWQRAPHTDLFVEVDPQQKERIVRALQRTGHAVGYLGDGINDAPALHAADVGISVDQAVDVARESADIVLVQPDLDVLRRGVEDGRRTFANTLKYIDITISANFGNMVSMALAAPFLPFLPLVAKQILLNNFVSDVPALAISTDHVDAVAVQGPRRWHVRDIRRFMLVFGLLSTAFDLAAFAVLLGVFHADQSTFQTAWFSVSLLTELAVVLVLRTHKPSYRSMPSPPLLWTTLAAAIFALALPYAGPLARVFDFVPLSAELFAAVLTIVVCYIAATELAKRRFFRNDFPGKERRD